MRPPVPVHTIHFRNCFACAVALGLCLCTPRLAAQDGVSTSASTSSLSTRDEMHQSDQWKEIERHLPNPVTATAQTLEQQGDILRARRFPEDAMDYYRYALARGGNVPSIMNKLGLTELEMRNIELARSCFQRAVKLDGKDAEAWNNLGAVEVLDGDARIATHHD